MSKTKKDVMDMINSKAKKYRELRKKAQNVKTPQQLILNFLEEVEKVYPIAKNADDFHWMMERLCENLDSQMKVIDLGAKMEVKWNDAKDWKDLQVVGVQIRWSNWYKKKHDLPDEQFMDVTMLLLEGFDE